MEENTYEVSLKKLEDGLINLGWSLWTELGVAGTIRRHEKCLISLEELIILTAVIADSDPRLRDEALDWCSRNYHLVSISRLKTLVKKFGNIIYGPFSNFVSTLNAITKANWPIFLDTAPLKFIPSNKSILPSLGAPALLQLRIRALFGVGARADLFTYFLTVNKNDFAASDVVEIGYSKRTLADLLDNLVQSGFLISTFVRNQRKYEFVKNEQLKRVAGELPEIAPPWQQILEILLPIRWNLQRSKDNSDRTKVVIMRNELDNIKNLLAEVHQSPPPYTPDPTQYLHLFCDWLLGYVHAISQGNFGGNFVIDNNFEKIIGFLLFDIYKVEDCLDGLEFIQSESAKDLNRHSEVFKESYLLSTKYIIELKEALQKLLDFRFHDLMDHKISEIVYEYSKNYFPIFCKFTEEYISAKQMTHPREALRKYESFQVELNKIHELLYKLREQLKKLYLSNTNIHLLTLSTNFTKRHEVINLYSPNLFKV